jgi:glutaredoxin
MLELSIRNAMKQHHTIEIFSAGCPLCRHITDGIEIGKCKGCNQTIYDINDLTEETKVKMKQYGITSVPTIIIDGSIKVVGIPDFPWICGNDLYKKLKREYSIR